jgi:hypothetical protein
MNAMTVQLYLHEQLMLLALRDEKGTIESKADMYQYALGGALLSELLLAGCVRLGEDKKKRIELVQPKTFSDPVLDECLNLIAASKRRRTAVDWVSRFADLKKLKERVAQGLSRRGILKESEDKVLLIFTRKIYPTIDPRPEKRLIEQLRKAIFTETARLDPRTAVLLSLADGTGMLPIHFDKKKLKSRKRRIDQITKSEAVGAAAREAVEAAQAAVAAVAVMIATTTAVRS